MTFWQIHKMATIFIQNGPRLKKLPFCEFAKLCQQSFISQLEISHVIYHTTHES